MNIITKTIETFMELLIKSDDFARLYREMKNKDLTTLSE